ncbi:MAG: hypothetical protein KBS59_00675 [Clostridiales bacterium]|nr:hypothetical protein [Clostridiales bacterium]
MPENENSYGRLIVRVSSANSAIPIYDATVAMRIVEDGRPRLFAVLFTDSSGETDVVDVPTPSKELSLSPLPDSVPYSVITIEVSSEGYYSAVNLGVPVFPGVTSVQNVNLIALPDGAGSGYVVPDIIVSESGAADL